uniref:Uncharacterized protein n=1 Tax=Arundo donax TaxID=35708 RepID=A0A0A8XWY1_ARUDO
MYQKNEHLQILYAPGTCNMVAHELSKMGSNLGPGGVLLWPDSVPNDVIPFVTADRSVHG